MAPMSYIANVTREGNDWLAEVSADFRAANWIPVGARGWAGVGGGQWYSKWRVRLPHQGMVVSGRSAWRRIGE